MLRMTTPWCNRNKYGILISLFASSSFCLGLAANAPQEVQKPSQPQTELSGASTSAILSDQELATPTPHKVHLRGLDDLRSTDIKSFVNQYYSVQPLEKIEWIDDTSANIVYATPAIALDALGAFVATHDPSLNYSSLELLPAKPFPGFPNTQLKVRLAVAGDRKQPGARERSRFYLLNPEDDRREHQSRDRRGGQGERRYRDRDDDYRRRVYDDREQRRRNDVPEFDASLYDDDETSLAIRASRYHSRRDSESESMSSDYRSQRRRKVRFTGAGKELFPERASSRSNGRLRDRSASPSRDIDGDERMGVTLAEHRRNGGRGDNGGGANRRKAQMIKARLRDSATTTPLELFPQKAGANRKRTDLFDVADSTADLFADKMRIPAMDNTDDSSTKKRDLMSRITKVGDPVPTGGRENATSGQSVFKIRGTASQPRSEGFSIKGLAASRQGAKELFLTKPAANAGKELFADRLDGRGGRRQKAAEMFS